MGDLNNIASEKLEKYSSAVTLSDMEIFIYPELMCSLVLANIMSPILWSWRDDPWFAGIEKLTPYRRILRLKQYIMDHYAFNLDLETWGLTTQERELARFKGVIDERTIAESNALFGYTGDRYYFDLDIRRHFGLDKYTSNVIPYWKTETIEAMDAFRFKPGYQTGAGECVSLAALYSAASFVVCKIPLETIYMMATPLHSQNFIDIADGVLTNNRRIVTKNMWFNGTELSALAQRALRHEQITAVAHISGYVHCVYPEATVDQAAYERLRQKLASFLVTGVDLDVLLSFFRQFHDWQLCFQVEQERPTGKRYVGLERVFHYEQDSALKLTSRSWPKLMEELDEYEFFPTPLPDRIMFNDMVKFMEGRRIDFDDEAELRRLVEAFHCRHSKAEDILRNLSAFVHLQPRLPDLIQKKVVPTAAPLDLNVEMTREQIVAYLTERRGDNPTADLAFYAWRSLDDTDWRAYFKAALERNPVSLDAWKDKSEAEVLAWLGGIPAESIYPGKRLAQPDELWNFGRGDGWEKALFLANILKSRHPEMELRLVSMAGQVSLLAGEKSFSWPGNKGIEREVSEFL